MFFLQLDRQILIRFPLEHLVEAQRALNRCVVVEMVQDWLRLCLRQRANWLWLGRVCFRSGLECPANRCQSLRDRSEQLFEFRRSLYVSHFLSSFLRYLAQFESAEVPTVHSWDLNVSD